MSKYKVLVMPLQKSYDVLEQLTQAQRGEVIWALINYFLDGVEPTFEEAVVKLAFNVLKGTNERSFAKNH